MSKKQLSAAQIAQRRAAGRKGYEAVIARLGKTEFHKRGGAKIRALDLYTSRNGAVGYAAAVLDGVHIPKGKQHRHGGK